MTLRMRFGHIELFVSDVARSRAFYERVLGFEVVAVQPRTVWLRCGGVELLLRPRDASIPASDVSRYDASAIAIVLYTDDLPTTVATLESRGLIFRGHDGADCCPTFTDPDGNWFQLVDPKRHE